MTSSSTNQSRFVGFCDTPNLWESHLDDIEQFHLANSGSSYTNKSLKYLRLGKLAEQFVIHELNQTPNLQIIVSNHQVQDGTRTVGELDCLFIHDQQPIHLEVVYKFYLYDASVGSNSLEHWIGPNRRDSLVKKLTKLKDKQLPLLYHPLTTSWLLDKGYSVETFKQYVCFKAQLFLPYTNETMAISPLNKACIQGFYLKPEQLEDFEDCKFYIPKKLDWLMAIPTQIDWLSYKDFKQQLESFLADKSAPLCWVKQPNGETLKCFVVWW